jgi:hypothetical protein
MKENQPSLDLVTDIPFGEATIVPKTIFTYWIAIDNKNYDLEDLYVLLDDLEDGNIYISDTTVYEMLKRFNVVNSRGSRSFPATTGDNFEFFKKKIDEEFWATVEKGRQLKNIS